MAEINKLIATINPNLYLSVSDDPIKARKELNDFKKKIKENGFSKVAEEAKPKPLSEHLLGYDSSSETLEPIYFFILDFMEKVGMSPEKLVDNFTSSPGSGHFAELGQRATIMQQQASKILGDVNTVLRSVLNVIYDLKEFRIRLQNYDDSISKDKDKSEAAFLSLKQIWLDKVDIVKGNSSLKAMALGQAGFQTLLDAFLMIKDEKLKDITGKELDLNDRVKRILKQRIQEFNIWVKQSEQELRKRYELEKTYLKSQVNSLKLYSRWAKPYLIAANELEMKQSKNAGLVKAFNTIILELTLLGKREVKVKEEAIAGNLPSFFANEKLNRKYYECVLVDFIFRGIPQRAGQQPHYVFGGKADVTFKAYALNEEELAKLNQELENSDIEDTLKLIEGATSESIGQLQEEINFFLEEKDKKEEEKPGDNSNPFFALLGMYDKKEKKKEEKKEEKSSKKKIEEIKPDSFVEAQVRKMAEDKAKYTTFDLFDIYKSAHGMVSYT